MANNSVTPVSELRPYELAVREMRNRAKIESTDGFEIAASVADKIMSADDIDGVLDAAESGPGDLVNLVGVPFRFIGGSLRFMTAAEKYREGGTGVYVVFSVLTAAGVQMTVSTGANNVVFQLRKLENLGVFDNDGEVYDRDFTIKSRETANGTLFRIAKP